MGKQWGVGLHLFSIIIFYVATKMTCLGAGNVTVGCFKEERDALLKFKHGLTDDYNRLSSWVGSDCCQWFGVRCDGATGHVVRLHLRGDAWDPFADLHFSGGDFFDAHFLGGEVNSALAELTELTYLDLSMNDFQMSHIPESFGSLKHLRYLNLSQAGFNGTIPHHLGNLSNLNVLDLSSNAWLIADDMAWVSGLSSLKHLDLSIVHLSQAQNLDKVLYMIPSLVELRLSDCGLFNAHLDSLQLNSSSMLHNIKHLDLSKNWLGDSLPYFLRNMTSLKFLDLSTSNIDQPSRFEALLNMIPSLAELHLSDCLLRNTHLAPIHVNVSALANIQHLDLSQNSILGKFPALLTNMSLLRSLDLSGNFLNSSIPIMPNLVKLDLSDNTFSHIIEHTGIWRQCYLKQLRVKNNNYLKEERIGPSTNRSQCSQYALEMLDLSGNQFIGPIPESLGSLTALRELDLQFNKLTGPIPISIGKLIALERLYLNSNQLTGLLPISLGKLVALERLSLESNQLKGPIPASLGRLVSLQMLSASSNLLNGPIPVSMGQLTKLVFLDVSGNSLEGLVFETHFANLSMLKYLDASSNLKLTFNISHEWIPPFQLRKARMGSCKIASEFPQWLQTQKELKELVLSNASIYGHLPTWLQKMPIIPMLDLSHNQLRGPLSNLPCSNLFNGFGNGHDEGSLLLKNNLFNGSIPKSLCNWTHLVHLDLSKNRLSGKIPCCLANLLYLKAMVLSSNGLSGVIPTCFCNISSALSWLNLNNNSFNGELPVAMGNCTNLGVLDLGDNHLSGSIPKWIGENLTKLVILSLHKNNFTGRIPRSLCRTSDLQILDIAHNNITGTIPGCFGELSGMVWGSYPHIYKGNSNSYLGVVQVIKGVDLEYTKTLNLVFNMDLSSNKLVGEIPEGLTALSLLHGLNLSHNHLSGGIPNSIGYMKSLASLDFSNNDLTGRIPPSMAALSFLGHLNLSHNNLSGQIPTGHQLNTFTRSTYVGNKELCGAPLPKNCSNHDNKDKGGDEPKKVWFYMDIMSGFAIGFWGVIGLLFVKKQWRHALFRFVELTMDKIHVAVVVRVAKMKRGI